MIPDKLRVGAHTIEIKMVDRNSHENCGSAVVDSCKIFIRNDMPPSMQLETLVHEVLHLVRTLNGTNIKDADAEERVVQADAHLLYQFLKDNPNLLQEIIALNEIQYI